MSSEETVSHWLAELKQGDTEAVEKIWERYHQRLVGLARRILDSSPRRIGDEEDVALSAFKSFYFRAKDGKFPKLEDRHDLWKLLMTITLRKSFRLRRIEKKSRAESLQQYLDGRPGRDQPTPEVAALFSDELNRLLGLLDDATLRDVALSKLEGYTNTEIAQRSDRSISFVERKLRVIRRIWMEEVTSES